MIGLIASVPIKDYFNYFIMEKTIQQFASGDKVQYKYYDSEKIHTGTVYFYKKVFLINSDDEHFSPSVNMLTLDYCELIS